MEIFTRRHRLIGGDVLMSACFTRAAAAAGARCCSANAPATLPCTKIPRYVWCEVTHITGQHCYEDSASAQAIVHDCAHYIYLLPSLLGPFHGAIAVPSVTRCRRRRRRRRGHRCAGGVRRDSSDAWWMVMRRAAARCGEWAQHFSNASCIKCRERLHVPFLLIRKALSLFLFGNATVNVCTTTLAKKGKCAKTRIEYKSKDL